MDQNRLKLLEQYVKEEPEDPFNWYALALEITNHDTARAIQLFDHVLTHPPDYLPSYYHAGNLHLSLGNSGRANAILKLGSELARKKGDLKALGELNTLLDELAD